MKRTLHYIYDPLCGWCYGASRLVEAAAGLDDLPLELHAGGLFPQPTDLPESMRSYIQQADSRIAAMNGVGFGEAYVNGLLTDPELVLHSRPTIAAVLAAGTLEPGGALKMLQAIQKAHYVEGRHVIRPEILSGIAADAGFDETAFADAMESVPADAHIAATRRLMAEIGASGFPTFFLEMDDRRFGVPHHEFTGDPAGFAAWLESARPAAAAV